MVNIFKKFWTVVSRNWVTMRNLHRLAKLRSHQFGNSVAENIIPLLNHCSFTQT